MTQMAVKEHLKLYIIFGGKVRSEIPCTSLQLKVAEGSDILDRAPLPRIRH